MRLFVSLIFILVSLSALACPNLAGSYSVCRSETGNEADSTDVVVTQSIQNRVTVYTMTGTDDEGSRTTQTIIADGKARTEKIEDEDSGLTFELVTQASCKGQALEMKISTKLQGQNLGSVTSVTSKRGSSLVTRTTGQMMGQTIKDTVTCE